MLTITDEQMAAFQRHEEADFINEILQYLWEEHSTLIEKRHDEVLKVMIQNGIKRARGYGLETKNNLTNFVAIMFQCAPNFDEYPSFQQILTSDSVPPESRLDLLLERASIEDWKAAKQGYNGEAWFPELLKYKHFL
jgi:hypothetical protein